MPKFSGVIAPVLTPFGEDGSADPDRFIEHCQWLMDEGCTGLAPFGTTSEGNSLGLDERMELLEEIVDADIAPDLLMPGTGTPSLADTIVLTKHAVELGCGGVLVLPPYYYKAPSEEGLYRYFSEMIEGVDEDDLKVYLYHIPPIAQVGFSLPLIERLRKAFPDVVVGLKDSSGDWSNTAAILEKFPDFEVFPGSEAFLLDGLRKGGAGCISATCNVNPAPIRKVFDNWKTGDADKLQEGISAVRKTVQAYPLITGLKAIVAHYRDDPEWAKVRPPFTELPAPDAEKLIAQLDALGFGMAFD